jgi:hypothetical protein
MTNATGANPSRAGVNGTAVLALLVGVLAHRTGPQVKLARLRR